MQPDPTVNSLTWPALMTQLSERNGTSFRSLSPSLVLGFVLISLMDRVRTNATLFAEHSARIKRSYAVLDTRVVSRFAIAQDRLFLRFSSLFLPCFTERILFLAEKSSALCDGPFFTITCFLLSSRICAVFDRISACNLI